MSKYLIIDNYKQVFCKSDYKAVGVNVFEFMTKYDDETLSFYLEKGYEQLEDNSMTNIESAKRVENFLDELMVLYTKYNVSISHEDGHGGFIIESDCDYNEEWIKDAVIEL